jgi:hypothetical protein
MSYNCEPTCIAERKEEPESTPSKGAWDPLGPDSRRIRQAATKKQQDDIVELAASGEEKLRAFMLAGNIVKRPPRIGVRELRNYSTAWGYTNGSKYDPNRTPTVRLG